MADEKQEETKVKKKHKLTAKITETTNPNDPESDKAVDITFYDGDNKIGEASVSGIDIKNGFLYNVEVFKKYRGQGYGNDIMDYVLSHYSINELTVEPDNVIAINLYKKYGFKPYKKFKENGKIMLDMRINKVAESTIFDGVIFM